MGKILSSAKGWSVERGVAVQRKTAGANLRERREALTWDALGFL